MIVRAGTVTALALIATTLGAPTASAAVAAPSNPTVSPAGASIPVLAWSPVAKATGYQVQVDNDASFGSPEFTSSTVNFRATPTTALRSGRQFWRVRTVKGTDTSSWREGDPFSVSPIGVPVAVAPINGVNLAQPSDPPLLQWLGSPGATSYTVEVDGDADFVGSKSYSTKTTSLVVPDPLFAGDWFWRVTAVKGTGLVSLPSQVATFNVSALEQPVLVSPADDVNTKVGDVALDWKPRAGARTYDVQISDGPTFDPATTTTATGVQGTRYSPKVTLNNDQFWWRVRAVDLNGQATTWAETNFGFNRAWEDQPQAVYPTGPTGAPTAVVTDRPYYQWTAVPKATVYELTVAADVNFSSGVSTCRVVGTTYAPRGADCAFRSGTPTYWKVRPIDKPYNTTGLPGQFYSPTQAFTWSGYSPVGTFSDFQPVTGMKVSVDGGGAGCTADVCDGLPTNPVLSWDRQPGITRYLVYIGQDNKFTTSVLAPNSVPIVTTNTMLTLKSGGAGTGTADKMSSLPDSSAGQAYHWFVRPCTATLCGPDPISSATTLNTKSFRKISPAVTGLRSSDRSGTEITFDWDDYNATNLATMWLGEKSNQSAKTYRIQVDNEPSFQAPLLDNQVIDQTTYTAADRLYPEGTLYWRVQATDEEDNGLTWSAIQSLTKESPAVPLQAPGDGASVAGTTPFRWGAQAFAASYTVEVYKNNDRSFSTVNRLFTTTVKTVAYAWNEPIPADPTPYIWRVRRTDAEGNPGPWSAPSTFTSLGAAPAILSPANGSWQPGAGTVFSWTDVPGASSYTLTATSGSGSRLVNVTTPGNAYATTKVIATGSYTWSVTALDAGGKALGTSLTGNFRVDATAPEVGNYKPIRSATPKTVFVAKFTEKVKGVSKKTVKLFVKGKKKPLKAKVVLKGRKLKVKPKAKLKKGKTYSIKFTDKKIADVAGNRLVKPAKWKVTVK